MKNKQIKTESWRQTWTPTVLMGRRVAAIVSESLIELSSTCSCSDVRDFTRATRAWDCHTQVDTISSSINSSTPSLSLSLSLCLSVSLFRFIGHFPGEPGLARVYWSKGWWKWWWQLELQVVQSSSQITTANQHQTFHRPHALPVAQPTVSKHWRENITFHGLAYPKFTWGSSNFVFNH